MHISSVSAMLHQVSLVGEKKQFQQLYPFGFGPFVPGRVPRGVRKMVDQVSPKHSALGDINFTVQIHPTSFALAAES